MTDKMPDKIMQVFRDMFTQNAEEFDSIVIKMFETVENSTANKLAALKAEHRADMTGLCDEIQCLSEYNLCEGTAILKDEVLELIKQRISDE